MDERPPSAQPLVRHLSPPRGRPAARASGGLGLRSVAGRVADLGGTWRLDNLPRGAVLSAALPLEPAMAEPCRKAMGGLPGG